MYCEDQGDYNLSTNEMPGEAEVRMYTTIRDIFEQTVQKYPGQEAIYDVRSGVRWTYAEWDLQVNRLANALQASGVQKGNRVSTVLFNTEELATTFFACAKLGAIFNPVNFRLGEEEIAYILAEMQPAVVIFEQAVEPKLAALYERFENTRFWFIDAHVPQYAVDYHRVVAAAADTRPNVIVEENDVYGIMYTSGTTGRPKGVMHRHRDVVEQSLILIPAVSLGRNDRGLVTGPMFHCAELHCAFLPRVHIGASNVILHHFDPSVVLQLIQSEQISLFFAAPTMWNMLLQEDLGQYDLQSLRVGLYGAAPMAPALVRACHEQLGIGLVQAYGMTEMGPAVTLLFADEQLSKAGSAGKACLNHEVRVVQPSEDGPSDPDDRLRAGEIGEVVVRGPCMMTGYYNRDELNERVLYKGWYHSGDLGYIDEDGYLWIADRVDDMIISGGENIYPREIEDVLYEHPGVLDAAVIDEADEKWGERVVAVIVRKDASLTAQDLEQFCRANTKLAGYKRPRRYVFVEALPRNASGKIQKYLLREQVKAFQ